jgi:hypothetical protein
MSAEIVNLKRFKKNKAREAEAKAAEANRLAFGRTKVERRKTEALQALESKRLDGLKLED